jgi:membrane-associated phospholipid phosphatase
MAGFATIFLGAWALDQPAAMRVAGAALSSIWVCSMLGRWGKGLTHRERPKTQGNNPDPLLWHGLPKPKVGSSAFPSGHTLGIWSWAWVIYDMVGGVPGGIAIAMAAGVGLQRMYVGAHWLSDVTASILIAKVVAERVIVLSTEKTLSIHVDAWDAETAAVGLTLRF